MITDNEIKRTLLEQRHGFTCGVRHYYIYPPTLGKNYINAQLLEELELTKIKSPIELTLDDMESYKESFALYVAYQTVNTKEECLDTYRVQEIADYICANADACEVAALWVLCLDICDINGIMKHLGINDQKGELKRVQQAKKNENTYIFGGKSIWGGLISNVCEKYHWTYDYVMWGISYANVQLLMADSIISVYLTDDEIKSAGLIRPNAKRVQFTPELMRQLKEQFK